MEIRVPKVLEKLHADEDTVLILQSSATDITNLVVGCELICKVIFQYNHRKITATPLKLSTFTFQFEYYIARNNHATIKNTWIFLKPSFYCLILQEIRPCPCHCPRSPPPPPTLHRRWCAPPTFLPCGRPPPPPSPLTIVIVLLLLLLLVFGGVVGQNQVYVVLLLPFILLHVVIIVAAVVIHLLSLHISSFLSPSSSSSSSSASLLLVLWLVR